MVHRIAIVGAGIGREHLAAYRALPERFDVSILCDQDADRAASILDGDSSIAIETDLATVLSDPTIDIVDICLPPHLHLSGCLDALKAGKHVVCEKPLVSSLKDAAELTAAVAASGKTLTPVFQYRYGPGLAKLRALMAADLCGKPLVASIDTHWDRDADYYDNPWRGTWKGEQGGAVLGHAIHNHDLLCSVFGPVQKLSAFTTTRVNPIETEDCASISFSMVSGAVASSSITLGAADNTTRFQFCFDRLTVTSGLNPYAPANDEWTFQARGAADQSLVDKCVADVVDVPIGYIGLFTELSKKLRGESNDVVKLDDGIRSLELVSAIYCANETSTVVELPLGTTHPYYSGWLPTA